MEWFTAVDWQAMFMPDTPLLEIFVRATVMYFVLFALLRLVLKRQAGSIGMTDLLVIVLLADAAQNAMAADYHSLADGIVLVSTLVFWNYTLEWLGFHFPLIERMIHPKPLQLIKNGRVQRKNMRKELISDDDLMSMLRQHGVEKISQVKSACMEGTGKISVVRKAD